MKPKIMTLVTLLCFMCSVHAAKWRINNTPGVDADFTTLKAAHESAMAGDTIYLEGSPLTYGVNDTINKQLIIIGPGYFLNENDTTQVSKVPAKLSKLTFMPGSEGSIINGVTLEYVFVNANNINLSRNNISRYITLAVSNSISNCIIKQNFITQGISSGNYSVFNVVIINNIITGDLSSAIQCYILLDSDCSGIIENNILSAYPYSGKNLTAYNSTIRNNIIRTEFTGSNNLIENNLSEVVVSDIFLLTGSSDGKYKLKVGSPAIGAGKEGVDCGAFGGSEPYVLSGIPAGPHIFDANVSTSGSAQSGLPVTLKIKTQN